MSNVIEHTEKEFEEALRAELEDDVEGEVLAEIGITKPAQPRPDSPKYPPRHQAPCRLSVSHPC
jgi:hypothetical protein